MNRSPLARLVIFTGAFALASSLSGQTAAPAAAEAPAGPPASTVASDQNYRTKAGYQVYFDDYLKLRQGKPTDLIFIGDSITEGWRWGLGIDVWRKHFEDRSLDFGLGSDKTQHVLWRLEHYDLSAWKPKVAIILIGVNNQGDTPEDIAAGVKAVVASTRAKFPGIKVIVQSILPTARQTERMAAVNPLLKPLADDKTIFFLDLGAKFTPDGDNWKGLGRDKLHLTPEGYEMWAAELEAFLPHVLGH